MTRPLDSSLYEGGPKLSSYLEELEALQVGEAAVSEARERLLNGKFIEAAETVSMIHTVKLMKISYEYAIKT